MERLGNRREMLGNTMERWGCKKVMLGCMMGKWVSKMVTSGNMRGWWENTMVKWVNILGSLVNSRGLKESMTGMLANTTATEVLELLEMMASTLVKLASRKATVDLLVRESKVSLGRLEILVVGTRRESIQVNNLPHWLQMERIQPHPVSYHYLLRETRCWHIQVYWQRPMES